MAGSSGPGSLGLRPSGGALGRVGSRPAVLVGFRYLRAVRLRPHSGPCELLDLVSLSSLSHGHLPRASHGPAACEKAEGGGGRELQGGSHRLPLATVGSGRCHRCCFLVVGGESLGPATPRGGDYVWWQNLNQMDPWLLTVPMSFSVNIHTLCCKNTDVFSFVGPPRPAGHVRDTQEGVFLQATKF